MRNGVDIDDVKAYRDALVEEACQGKREAKNMRTMYLCACILAAADRISNAGWCIGESIDDPNHPSAE